MKFTLSKRLIAILLAALIVLSAINTYLIVSENLAATISGSGYDYIISQSGDNLVMKNSHSNQVVYNTQTASQAINTAFSNGNSVFLQKGNFILTGDVVLSNKMNAKIAGSEATIYGDGHKITIRGDNYTFTKYPTISDLTIINATLRVENCFGATISNILFENCPTGIELANTDTWTEGTKVENCHFINCTEGIAFRTPVENGTGSYSSTEVNRCFFNQLDNSVAINVEERAEFSDSQLQDVRVWMGEIGKTNQTGLRLDGSMQQSLLFGVVFESFTASPIDMFAVGVGESAFSLPILDGGVSFLGNWTAMVHNPYGKWVSGVESAFSRTDIKVPVGLSGQYRDNATINAAPLKISTFKPKITVQALTARESVTVRIRLEFIDNTFSKPVEKTFSSTSSVWLSDDDMLALFPSQNVVWAVIVDAKSSANSSGASVQVSGYGTAG